MLQDSFFFLLHRNSLYFKRCHTALIRVYLSKPEEVLHEGHREGILHLHDRNLILGRHQNVVVSVQYGGEIETSGRRQNSSSLRRALPKECCHISWIACASLHFEVQCIRFPFYIKGAVRLAFWKNGGPRWQLTGSKTPSSTFFFIYSWAGCSAFTDI